MKCIGNRYTWVFGLAVLIGTASYSHAQAPVGGAAPAGGAAAATAAAGGGGNLWSFLLPTAEQRAACREKFCNCAIGKMLNAGLAPISAFSGGLISSPCGLPTAEDLALPEDSAEGAAAKIKQDALEAKKRAAAVRYLGTVDCSRWPEAELGLINALRGDRNECVRWEAAKALARGCCCTPKTAAALSIVVSGSNRDGFPVEKSQRVRYAAGVALDHCLACLQPETPVLPIDAAIDTDGNGKQKNGEGEGEGGGSSTLPAPKPLSESVSDSKKVVKKPAKDVKAKKPAKDVKAKKPAPRKTGFYQQVSYETVMPMVKKAEMSRQTLESGSPRPKTPRPNGLLDIVGHAFSSNPRAQTYSNQVTPAVYAPVYNAPPTAVPVQWNSSYGQPAPVHAPQTRPQSQNGSPYAPAPTGNHSSSPMPVGPVSQHSDSGEYEVAPASIDEILAN